MDTATIERLGTEIYRAEREATALRPLSSRHPGLDPAAAYQVQEHYARLRTADGARLVGRKIGCTSTAIQELFGIDTPDYGQLFDDMVVGTGVPIPIDRLIAPMVEPEIGFLLAADVRGPDATAAGVLAATDRVVPAVEIIDSRIEDWRIEFVDTVADNGSSARYVLGPPVPLDGRDLVVEQVVLTGDGTELYRGDGAAVLGHPAAAVAWLANVLAGYDRHLPAGSLVLSGSMTRAAPAVRGRSYQATFTSLGTVSCRFV
ncbi:2-keto-4-pentenoate hydratase [Jiangella asiatica]|uniref:2-keto-4-pentenoate hydratase n=1 Tax=Jiangella asiatica TaxID=2530372 RepID=A0A4V6PFM9_9ACTN|nr:2-keto-4-pentenoate hydratase [Jiangella asiatica]TDE09908.1 2-keto-4-pentenoate hydratase [Jiangella asiatica]